MQQTVLSGNEAEKECVRLAQRGDASAHKEIYFRYVRYLTAVCARYIARDEDLKDVLQESFVKILSSIGGFEYRGDGSLKAWVTRIAVNEALKFLERETRFNFVSRGPELLETVESDDTNGVEDVPPQVVHEMIRNLPTGYRMVFNLHIFEGKSHREIADRLNIGESTSASQLHRAKAILAGQIREYRKNKSIGLEYERSTMER